VIVDGYVLPQPPAAIYASGQQARVPLLAGWNSAEGSAHDLLGAGPATEENFKAALRRLYGDQAGAARQAYFGAIDRAARELASDRFIGFGTWRWIDLHAGSSGQPAYRYYYTHPRPAARAGGLVATGAGHSVEIEYVLGNLDGNPAYEWTAADRAVSRQAQAYFANFGPEAVTGRALPRGFLGGCPGYYAAAGVQRQLGGAAACSGKAFATRPCQAVSRPGRRQVAIESFDGPEVARMYAEAINWVLRLTGPDERGRR
jgi:hypothetical protein